MNERIKALLDEATVYALHETKDAVDFLDNPVSKQQRELQLEKFAELIVRECLELTLGKDRKQLLDKGDLNGANLLQKDIVRVIKHFGVEE